MPQYAVMTLAHVVDDPLISTLGRIVVVQWRMVSSLLGKKQRRE